MCKNVFHNHANIGKNPFCLRFRPIKRIIVELIILIAALSLIGVIIAAVFLM